MNRPISIDEAEGYRAQFPIFEHKIYLNSCSLGPLSRSSRRALEEYAEAWTEFGAPAWWERWIPKIDQIKGVFATVIGCTDTSSLTIHHSVSSALSSVASAIDYSRRNRVVVSEIDFPTIAYQWLVKPNVEVVFARSHDGITVPLEEYERLIDDRTAAVATSHVFYATGAVQDIGSIARLAHQHGAMAIVDGYHSVGLMPVDVEAAEIDFYVGGTLKWVCGGPGLTFIYASPTVLPHTTPTVTGWFASDSQFAFETTRFTAAASADRFQMGTPSVATVYTGIPALSMLLEAGLHRIYARVQALTHRTMEQAERFGFETASPRDDEARGGVVMLRLPEPERAVQALAEEGVVVDARPGKLRISPHFFNTEADLDRTLSILDAVYQPSIDPMRISAPSR